MTKLIKLSGVNGVGKYVKVDDEDFEYLNQFNWYYSGNYAVRKKSKEEDYQAIKMHREIMNVTKGKVVDHINGDTLDNRKSNLRICTPGQNSQNNKVRTTNSTGYKGVTYSKPKNKWSASIGYDNKRKWIGYFDSPEDAAKAYDYYAHKYHGQFARLNFPNDDPVKPIRKPSASKYRGVFLDKRDSKWYSQISKGGQRYNLGVFENEEDAARAYNQKAIELNGDKAVLNIIPEGEHANEK